MENHELIDKAADVLGGFAALADRVAYSERTLKRVRSGEIPLSAKLEALLDRIISEAPKPRVSSQVQEQSNVEPYRARFRMIPVYTFVPGGSPVDFEVLPADWQDTIGYDGNDPKAFALRLVGESMMPQFEPGTILTVSPSGAAHNGDHVIATIKNEGSLFKKFYVSGDHKTVTLVSYNEKLHPPIIRPREDFHSIYRVVKATLEKKL